MEKIRIRSSKVGAPVGPFVQAVKAGNLLYISGQVARGLDGNVVGKGDPAAQMRHIMENLKAIVEEAGGTLADIVKVTVFVKRIEDYPVTWEVRRQYFGDTLPSSTLVAVKELLHPDFLIEIEAVAVI